MVAPGEFIEKDPDAVWDIEVDWDTLWLPTGDTITASTFTVESGLTKDSENFTDTQAKVWLSGGTAGVTYTITNHITTTEGREEDCVFYVKVAEKA